MTRNPNLVPASVVDKNGKLTTVHKRLDTGVTAAGAIPPPTNMSASAKAREALDRIVEAKAFPDLTQKLGGVVQSKRDKRILYNLCDLAEDSSEALNEVVEHIVSASPEEQRQWAWSLSTNDLQERLDFPSNSESFRIRMACYPMTVRMRIKSSGLSECASQDDLIEYSNFLSQGNYGDNYSHIKALVLYAAVYKNMEYVTNVEDEMSDNQKATIRHISENMDELEELMKSEQILEHMLSRKTAEIDALKQYQQAHSGLREGTL